MAIHPSQIEIANDVFAPTRMKSKMRANVEAYQAATRDGAAPQRRRIWWTQWRCGFSKACSSARASPVERKSSHACAARAKG